MTEHGSLEEDLARYADLDVCSISDAADALDLRRTGEVGTLTGVRAAWEGARALGWAVTMRLEDGPAPAGSVHLGVRAIAQARPGDVIVVDNGGRLDAGSWGGLLSTAATTRGVGGVVTFGAARDIDEARQLGFPLFGLGATPQTARGRCHEASCGEPVHIAGLDVAPGDLVAADGTGVVVVARRIAHAVLNKALELAARESGMRDALLGGLDPVRVLGGDYEDMLATTGSSAKANDEESPR
jgi:4-hydroxy-4-methyl-2-oxoglutarate aldolase